MNRTRSVAGASLFIGAAAFWLVNTVAESSCPGYDVKTDALSRLGSVGAPTRALWDVGLGLLAASWVLGMTLLFRGSGHRAWFALNLTPGIAAAIVALVPAGSVSAVHWIAAYTTFLTGGLIAVVDSPLVRTGFRYVGLALGLTTLGGLVLGPFIAPTLGFGGTERLVAYPILAWLMGFGSLVMAGGVEIPPAGSSAELDRWLRAAVGLVVVVVAGIAAALIVAGPTA